MFAADIAATQLALLFSVWTRMLLRPMELQAAMKFELALALLLLPVTTALLGLYPGYRITGVERRFVVLLASRGFRFNKKFCSYCRISACMLEIVVFGAAAAT